MGDTREMSEREWETRLLLERVRDGMTEGYGEDLPQRLASALLGVLDQARMWERHPEWLPSARGVAAALRGEVGRVCG